MGYSEIKYNILNSLNEDRTPWHVDYGISMDEFRSIVEDLEYCGYIVGAVYGRTLQECGVTLRHARITTKGIEYLAR